MRSAEEMLANANDLRRLHRAVDPEKLPAVQRIWRGFIFHHTATGGVGRYCHQCALMHRGRATS